MTTTATTNQATTTTTNEGTTMTPAIATPTTLQVLNTTSYAKDTMECALMGHANELVSKDNEFAHTRELVMSGEKQDKTMRILRETIVNGLVTKDGLQEDPEAIKKGELAQAEYANHMLVTAGAEIEAKTLDKFAESDYLSLTEYLNSLKEKQMKSLLATRNCKKAQSLRTGFTGLLKRVADKALDDNKITQEQHEGLAMSFQYQDSGLIELKAVEMKKKTEAELLTELNSKLDRIVKSVTDLEPSEVTSYRSLKVL